MEKLDLDDQQEESSSQVLLDLEAPEDSVYEPSAVEEEAFVADVLGNQEAVTTPAKYGSAPARDGWPVHTYETKGGKGIKISHDEWGTFWTIEFVPGGQMPPELKGKFTSDVNAKFAVELYLAKQD